MEKVMKIVLGFIVLLLVVFLMYFVFKNILIKLGIVG